MQIRAYKEKDYHQLADLYRQSDQFRFDEVTDSKEALERKIQRDPESLLVVEEEGKIIGSVSIIEDGRIAFFFRLIANPNRPDKMEILQILLKKAESKLKERGYREVHSVGPANNNEALKEREQLGFKRGDIYTWFWKEMK